MFDILDGFVGRAESLILGVMVVVAIAFVAATWVKTRALMPTLGALLLGSIVIFGVANFRGLADVIGRDVQDEGDGVQIRQVPRG